MNFLTRLKSLDADASVDVSRQLRKTLSWPHLIALGVGAIVGTGIYTLTGVGASLAGPGVILSFALAGLVCAFAALAYAEMATLIPTAGSAYTYTYSVIGEVFGWIVGWSLVLEYALACSAVAVGWSAHILGFLHGTLGVDLPPVLTAGLFDGGVVNIMAIVITGVITGLLLLGTRESATVNIVLVLIKLVALAAFIIIATPAIETGHYQPFTPYGLLAHEVNGVNVGVAAAAAIVFFAFFGFDAVSTSAEETRNPGRDLTIGIIGSMALCTIIYMLVAAAAVGAVPFADFAASGEPLPYILRTLGHPVTGALVGAAAIIALPSVILVMMYGQSRIFFVMSRDGLIPAALSKVNQRGVPARITLITGVFVAIFAGFVPLKSIAELSNAGTLLAFISVSASMIVLRVRAPGMRRDFKAPVFWFTGPAAIGGCVFLFCSLSHFTMLSFALWNAIGVVVYFAYGVWNSRLRVAAQPRPAV